MENQNIKWENHTLDPEKNGGLPTISWGEQPQQPHQPQILMNWDEQPQSQIIDINNNEDNQPQQENVPTWGEQPLQEQPQQGWDEQQHQNQENTWNWEEESIDPQNLNTPTEFSELNSNDIDQKTSFLGLIPKLKIEPLIYKFNYNDEEALSRINLDNLQSLDNDGKYKIDYQDNDDLINILTSIKNIRESRGLKLQHSFLYKNSPRESTINISRGECIYNYIYFLKANHNSGDVVLDFSAINGPSEKVIDASNGILLLLPGWVPYNITKNLSNEDMVAISGRFII